PSHVDTFDLKEGPWLPARFNPTSYGDGVRFPQGLMPKVAAELGNGTIGFVRSVRAWAGVHGLSQQWVQIGRNPTSPSARISPHIGSVVSLELSPPRGQDVALPAFMAINAGQIPGEGYLPAQYAPFLLAGGAALPNTAHPRGPARLDQRYGLLQELDAETRSSFDIGEGAEEMANWNARARMLMYNSAVDNVFRFDNNERTRYGNSAFGNGCLTARNLLRARMGTRFVQINFGSWDHHSNIYAPNAQLTPMATQFDNGLGNLIADLRGDGLLDDTLIVAMGEFGRTVGPVNANSGRDHFLQQSALFAGAGIRGGRAIGKTDDTGSRTVEPGWSRDRDVRNEDIEATLYSALGIDWTTIRRDDPLGRGFEYVPNSREDLYGPVHELWS
ncbi:MAG: DUF1501 domain-containing protein, partial [Candidatus Solibacter usitatus]|nr:DUF1501 domain-containing protein [Candidatus Solibacter usitatus]